MNRLALLSLAFALPACFGSDARPGPAGPAELAPADGALVVEWSLDGSTDPAACQQSSADSMDVEVDTPGGHPVGEFNAACEDFATRIPLAEGDYTGDALLLDPDGNDRTTAVALRPFTIIAGTDLHIPIDFPADSFL